MDNSSNSCPNKAKRSYYYHQKKDMSLPIGRLNQVIAQSICEILKATKNETFTNACKEIMQIDDIDVAEQELERMLAQCDMKNYACQPPAKRLRRSDVLN